MLILGFLIAAQLYCVGMAVIAVASIVAPESRLARVLDTLADDKPKLLQADIEAALRELEEIPDPLRERFLLLEKENPTD